MLLERRQGKSDKEREGSTKIYASIFHFHGKFSPIHDPAILFFFLNAALGHNYSFK